METPRRLPYGMTNFEMIRLANYYYVMAGGSAATMLARLCEMVAKSGRKLYLFIDEYDHFTNSILSDAAGMDNYKEQPHGNGALRAFYDAIKSGTTTAIGRVYITGVSPVTMDDLTSGFNPTIRRIPSSTG